MAQQCPRGAGKQRGSRFTGSEFSCWRDNVFVKRLWKSLKYEEVYLHACGTVSAARAGIGKYFAYYNAQRPHTALDRKPPDHVYFKTITTLPLAAVAQPPPASTYPDRETV